MITNLISTKFINPKQFPVPRLKKEVAEVLGITEDKIEAVERYPYQLWVHIQGVGGKFVSYRRLPIWLEKAIEIIKNSTQLKVLNRLGNLLWMESRQYKKQYLEETLVTLKMAGNKKKVELEEKERELASRNAHQQEAQQWLLGWQEVVIHCQNREFLQSTMAEIQRQKQQFADFANVVKEVEKIWGDRWQKLGQTKTMSIV
jgi:hypothetical protein